EALRVLKQHLARHLAGLVKELARVEAATELESPPDTVTAAVAALANPSAEYVHIDRPADNVFVIKFRAANDRTEIKDLVADLGRVFAGIQQSACKAIILASEYSGFLPEIEQAAAESAVLDLQRLILESPIPVVAALDGNAKCNAWLTSQFCDACVYS